MQDELDDEEDMQDKLEESVDEYGDEEEKQVVSLCQNVLKQYKAVAEDKFEVIFLSEYK